MGDDGPSPGGDHVRTIRSATIGLALVLIVTTGATTSPAATAAVPPGREGGTPQGRNVVYQSFLETALDDLLDFDAPQWQRDRWFRQLVAGESRTAIARRMVRSEAHARILVTQLYRRILGRDPDAAGRDHWARRMATGLSTASMAARLHAAAEFSPLGAGQEGVFVDRTYRVALGRPPDGAGRAHWIARLRAGEHRTVMARAFFLTPESIGLRVRGYYVDLLRRPPDPAGRAHWVERLRRTDDRELAATLVGSQEYVALSLDVLARPAHRFVAGNGPSSDPAVSGDGRWAVFSSRATDLTPGDANGHADVFLADLLTWRIERLTDGDGDSTDPDISPDGTTVAFTSTATDLVAGDTGTVADVFHLDLATGTVTQLTRGDGPSGDVSLDGDGTHVAFSSAATDLVAGDANGRSDVFVATVGPTTALARVSPDDAGVTRAEKPQIAAGGGALVFDVVTQVASGPRADAVLVPLSPPGAPVRISAGEDVEDAFRYPAGTRGPSGGDGPSIDAGGTTVTYGRRVFDVARGTTTSPVIALGNVVGMGSLTLSDDGTTAAAELLYQWSATDTRPFLAYSFHLGTSFPAPCAGSHPDLSADGSRVVAAHLGGIVTCTAP